MLEDLWFVAICYWIIPRCSGRQTWSYLFMGKAGEKSEAEQTKQEQKSRTLQELNLLDGFLFYELAGSREFGEKFCRIILERILGRPLKKICVSVEKTLLGMEPEQHGIRIDAEVMEEDGSIYDLQYTIFLYTKGKDESGQSLADLLRYMEDSREENATDEVLEILSRMVETVKRDREVGAKYMRMELHDLDVRNAARKEALEEGRKEGCV